MLLCAQYILPVTSEPIVDGAVLVRDGVIRDIGSADMLRLRYPDEEVVDQGLAAIMPGLVDLHTRLEQSVLRGVVTDGTGTAARISGVDVAGKTGTAERGDGTSNSWFVGMAPADNPRVVVAIVIEKGDSGEGAAKAQGVLKTALQVQGLA